MDKIRRAFLAGMGSASAALAFSSRLAEAQTYPQRPVKIIVPYAAGGGTDAVTRLLGAVMERELKQPFVIENRGGGASIPGTQAVATAPADGHTIGMVDSAFLSNPALFRLQKLPYDTRRDFRPISLLARQHIILIVLASSPIRTAQELVSECRKQPGKLTFASAGIGTAIHLAGEQLRQSAKIDFVTVPYRGGGPALTDFLGGAVSFAFHSYAVVREHIISGRVRVLGVAGPNIAQAPEIPTLASLGLAGIDAANDLGLIAPAATPDAIINTISASARKAITTPPLRDQIVAMGITPIGSSPAEYVAHVDREIDKWMQLMVAANIKAE